MRERVELTGSQHTTESNGDVPFCCSGGAVLVIKIPQIWQLLGLEGHNRKKLHSMDRNVSKICQSCSMTPCQPGAIGSIGVCSHHTVGFLTEESIKAMSSSVILAASGNDPIGQSEPSVLVLPEWSRTLKCCLTLRQLDQRNAFRHHRQTKVPTYDTKFAAAALGCCADCAPR